MQCRHALIDLSGGMYVHSYVSFAMRKCSNLLLTLTWSHGSQSTTTNPEMCVCVCVCVYVGGGGGGGGTGGCLKGANYMYIYSRVWTYKRCDVPECPQFQAEFKQFHCSLFSEEPRTSILEPETSL